jgi:hypothetical protein
MKSNRLAKIKLFICLFLGFVIWINPFLTQLYSKSSFKRLTKLDYLNSHLASILPLYFLFFQQNS